LLQVERSSSALSPAAARNAFIASDAQALLQDADGFQYENKDYPLPPLMVCPGRVVL